MTSLTVPAFWDIHRAPPEYRCAQPGPVCAPLGPSEWVCGPFSEVRAMRSLGRLLEDGGLSDIAPLCAASRPGYIESRINRELARVTYQDDPERWFRLEALKMKARNIRKWGIEP